MLVAWHVSDMITELGGRIASVAFNLEAAHRAIEASEFDCAILDMNLNGVLSLPIAAALRREGVPFIFVTAYHKETALLHGADGAMILPKPVDKVTLGNALIQLLRLS